MNHHKSADVWRRENDNNKQNMKSWQVTYVIAIEFLRVKTFMLLSLAYTQLGGVGCQHEKVLSFDCTAGDDGERSRNLKSMTRGIDGGRN